MHYFSISVHLNPFSVSDQLTGRTGLASNMQVLLDSSCPLLPSEPQKVAPGQSGNLLYKCGLLNAVLYKHSSLRKHQRLSFGNSKLRQMASSMLWLSVFYCFSLLPSSADMPTSDMSTKRNMSAEDEEKKEEENSTEEVLWPVPLKRVSPPVRCASVLPDDVVCPDGCELFSSSEQLDPTTVSKLRYGALYFAALYFCIFFFIT